MNGITEKLLGIVSDWAGSFNGAFNIRENGQCAGRQSTAHIKIESKTDVPGLDIRILPGTKGESVSIPACVTHGDVDDLSLIHISEPTRQAEISYAVFCLKKKKQKKKT